MSETLERIWAWEVDNDGWWDTDKPDWIEAPTEYIRADLAAAQTDAAVMQMRVGLEAACDLQNWIEENVPDEIIEQIPTSCWNKITNAVMAARLKH